MRGKVLFGAAMAALSVAGAAGVAKADPAIKWKGAPETSEEDRAFKVNGRVMYDVYNVDNSGHLAVAGPGVNNYTRTAVRRAFLGVEGRLTQNWRYNVKFDLTPDNTGAGTTKADNAIKADDLYIEYAGSSYSIFLGQNNAISPMEDRDSSLAIPFNERSGMIQAFGYGKQMGIAYLTNGGNWSAGAGLYGDALGTATDAKPIASGLAAGELTEERARVTFAPFYEKTPNGTKLLHLGLTARHRDTGRDGNLSYSVVPNNNFVIAKYISTAGLTNSAGILANPGATWNATSDTAYGGEFAAQWNAFGIEGEYQQLQAKRGGAAVPGVTGDPTFKGGYFDIFWSPTGESRSYNAADGSFKNIVPFRTLGSDGGIGHIMLSARYDMVDLTDSGVVGGKQTAYVGGVTWIPVDHIKFQLNYSHNREDLPTTTGVRTGTANGRGTSNDIVWRTQIDW